MGYSSTTLNYLERLTLFDLAHMMNMANLEGINIETPRIDCRCSLEKDFAELIYMNSSKVLY